VSQTLLAYLKDWLLPPGSLLLMLVLGLLLWRRISGWLLVLLATLALYLLAIPQTSAWLAAPLETDPSADVDTIRASGAQAILVFLAGRTHKAPELGGNDGLSALSLQRLHHAVWLHRQTGLPLALSGGAAPRPGAEGLATLAARALNQVYGVQPLIVEATSRNTRENATESARLLRERGIDKVVLVTHAWHMPRARYSAEMAGLTVIPAGTAFQSASAGQPGQASDWLPTAKALLVNRNLLHEHLGLLWYRYGPTAD
jgi:uncharacterized SAM-binding protein YcdF (DUF218 family)